MLCELKINLTPVQGVVKSFEEQEIFHSKLLSHNQ